jgi:3-hydroxyisobutyrate dehydrogenase-like beta-hydroxyacid dehydrogenase
VLDGPAGTAARLKLVRSVFMKGRDALVLEMMLAARRLGVEDEVARSIAGPGEQVPFTELSERVLRALAVHAGRRAEELDSSAALLRELGVDPLVTEAGAERLRRLAATGLRERLGGERPPDGRATLDAAEEASP